MLRLLGGIALVGLLGLLFWSNQLLEQEVKGIRGDIGALRLQLDGLALAAPSRQQTGRPHIDPSLPNLLEEDRYYAETVPRELGLSFQPVGHLKTAEVHRPQNLHPFNNWYSVHQATLRCVGMVAAHRAGFHSRFSPDLAVKVEERGNEFWVHLRDNIQWAPLNPDHFPSHMHLAPHFCRPHPVTAHDFKFFYDLVKNPHIQEPSAVIAREEFQHVEAFWVVDEKTFVIRWKADQGRVKYRARALTLQMQPIPCWVYQYFPDGTKIVENDQDPDTYQTHSVFAENFSRHWAANAIPSCGPYLFDGFAGKQLSFKRNPHYHNPYAVLHEKLTIFYKEDGEAIWQAFKAGELDFVTSESFPDRASEVSTFCASPLYQKQQAEGFGIKRLDYLTRGFYYVGWNHKSPFFSDPLVRQAMTHAIDRKGCIDQLLNQLGAELTGPLIPTEPAYDATLEPLAYDPAEAQRLLQEAGWVDLNQDGILDKKIGAEQVKFSFSLPYPSRSRVARSYVDAIATSLREIGIECHPFGIETSDLSHLFDGKEFDAVFGGWVLTTEPDPKQLWHSSGADRPGSSNTIGFANQSVDQLIEALEFEHDREKRVQLQRVFHRIIYQETPYTFLFVPKVAFLHRETIGGAFIPAERQDLIPGAVSTQPDIRQLRLTCK